MLTWLIEFANWLGHWHNWPFVISLFVGLGFVFATLLGLAKDADHGIDIDGDGSPDIHAPDIAKPEFGKPELGKGGLDVFGLAGVGKMPLSVVLKVFLLSFGSIGLLVNAVGRDLLSDWGVVVFPVSLVAAFVGSVVSTRGVAEVIAKFAPPDMPTSRKAGEFVGSVGVAASLISSSIGQVRVAPPEPESPEALLNACVDPEWVRLHLDRQKDANQPYDPVTIPREAEVVLIGYDSTRHLYLVQPTK